VIDVVRADITTLAVDAIVNAANSELAGGGGVDGAIHRAAGPGLMEELRQFPGCPTGSAVITGGHDLPARFVIHAVGPVWRGGGEGERDLLARAYESSFALAAAEPSVRTIAFPAISTGVYGFPRDEAARIAVSEMRRHEAAFERIVACLFDEAAAAEYRALLA
jgi:O-acetyl-ADP-ribose deacetylase (regulator of RNase III)